MAQINKPTDYFNTVLFTGNGGSSIAVTGVGFQPDWIWMKSRSDLEQHTAWDAVRGGSKRLMPDGTNVEYDNSAEGIQSFDSDGFTGGQSNQYNKSGQSVVAWNWLAGGTASSNTDGSITSSVSASTTSGFSIVTYSGSNSNSSVGHGLGVAPKMIIIKRRTGTGAWLVGNTNIGWTKRIYLHATDAAGTYNNFQDTAPTSSVFTLTGNLVDSCQSGSDYVAYCFAEKKGYSKFGSYTGNGNTDGTFVYTGFAPAWVMIKRTDSTGDWILRDNKMKTFNVRDNYLLPSSSGAEVTSAPNNKIDLLSNGFKQRSPSTGTVENASGGSYIYMCFAESGLVGTNNIPAVAR